MNDDLISREALKEKAETVTLWNGDVRRFISYETIDNAKTAEVPENTVDCVLTMFGKCSYNETGCSDCEIKDKIHKALNDRPTGEWKDHRWCSNCGCGIPTDVYGTSITEEEAHFCVECGAKNGGRL